MTQRGPGWAAGLLLVLLGGCGFDLIGGLDDQESGSTGSTGSGGTTTSFTAGTTTDEMDGESSSSGAPGPRDCCEGQLSPGCDDQAIESCVCNQDSFCCDQVWDEFCAEAVDFLGCGECTVVDTDGAGSCCEAKPEPGCEDSVVEDCVCAYDSFCCEYEWDTACVSLVQIAGCGICESTGDCCVDNGTPGCEDPAVEACVCEQDSFCCEAVWDFTCVATAREHGCIECVFDGGPCCEEHPGTGCDDVEVQDCVCAADYFCCAGSWDQFCVDEVEDFGCGFCMAGDTTSGDAGTGGSSGGSSDGSGPASSSTGTSAGSSVESLSG